MMDRVVEQQNDFITMSKYPNREKILLLFLVSFAIEDCFLVFNYTIYTEFHCTV